MRAALVGLVCAGVLVAGCGDHATPGERAVDATSARLRTITSGSLDFRLTAGAGDRPTEDDTGFKLTGPFALARPGRLPVAKVDYTELAGPSTTTVRLLATGDKAYVVLGGRTYALPESEVESLRAPAKGSGSSSLGQLHLDRWVRDPRVGDGGTFDGVPATRVQGTLRVVDALNELFSFSRALGAADAAVPTIEGRSARDLERVTTAASFELLTGRDDHLLRRLVADVHLGAQVSPAVRQALGRLAAARIHFEMSLADVNRPVQVAEPTGVLPASSLPHR
jgi:hypothetical protein